MTLSILALWLAFMLVAVAAVLVCWWALHPWQMKILRRERGDLPTGFPVKFPDD